VIIRGSGIVVLLKSVKVVVNGLVYMEFRAFSFLRVVFRKLGSAGDGVCGGLAWL
jgi:hypothetical protein